MNKLHPYLTYKSEKVFRECNTDGNVFDFYSELARQLDICQDNCDMLDINSQINETLINFYKAVINEIDNHPDKENLPPEVFQIKKICEETLEQNSNSLSDPVVAILHSLPQLRAAISSIKSWLGFNSSTDTAFLALIDSGKELLPEYTTILNELFITTTLLFDNTLADIMFETMSAKLIALSSYQENTHENDIELIKEMADCSDLAYNGGGRSPSGRFTAISKNTLPDVLAPIYDEDKGLLISNNGLKVWLGTDNRDSIVIAYCGTEISNLFMDIADIEQLVAPSLLYVMATGLLSIMKDNFDGYNFYITGHSLGGGLSQFATTAVFGCNEDYTGIVTCMGFNSAGLSLCSLNALEPDRLDKAQYMIKHYATPKDFVSPIGAQLGFVTVLPRAELGSNSHSLADVKFCLDAV